jgi:HlyD family secretion protein
MQLDEFYLNQVNRDMKVWVQLDNQRIEASISKVDSRVTNALFTVEVALPSSVQTVRRGQSVDADIMLGGDKANATLLKRGAFFSSTGGNWVYVVSNDGEHAQRRDIRLGKRNQQFFEVLDGLAPGERVITSSYSAFDKATQLTIQ